MILYKSVLSSFYEA